MIKGRIPFLSDAEGLAPVDVHDPLGELPVPTLDERVLFYLRAVHGNRDFTQEERSNARNVLLNSMAAEIAAQAEQSPKGELPGRETTRGGPGQGSNQGCAVQDAARALCRNRDVGTRLNSNGWNIGISLTYPHTRMRYRPSQQDRPPHRLPLLARSRLGLPPRSNMWCRSHHNAAKPCTPFSQAQQGIQHCLVRQLGRIDLGPKGYTRSPFASEGCCRRYLTHQSR
jgi:hypothetical protein